MGESAAFDELTRQISSISERLSRIESESRRAGAMSVAGLSVPVSTWADLPANPRTGQIYFVLDKTTPGATYAGVLAVYSGSRWLAAGEDVSGF
jgi:hypothetical protein